MSWKIDCTADIITRLSVCFSYRNTPPLPSRMFSVADLLARSGEIDPSKLQFSKQALIKRDLYLHS